ncbi:hypothetical protein [Candidatus Leptofilum sp.]|uniref:hypothetical protein n=1 Tax=Candidatus Leptofilum sp. TaxID=3241576 RepID=UPI003B5C16EE
MSKRPFTKHSSLFFLVPLLIIIISIFTLLPQAKPTVAEQPGSGACVRFSLHQGRNTATGAGVAGRYEMWEVATGSLIAAWEGSAQATISDWFTEVPQVSAGGSWVNVNFYPAGEETAVPLEILNPAPNTTYGWVANGQCHAVELQFPIDWSIAESDSSTENAEIGIGGGGDTWEANLNTVTLIRNATVSNTFSFFEVSNFGALIQSGQNLDQAAYGFTLTNLAEEQFITDLQIAVVAYDSLGIPLTVCFDDIRDIFPSEKANIGNVLCSSNNIDAETEFEVADIDRIELEFVSANQLELSDEPESLIILPIDDIETFSFIPQQPLEIAQTEIFVGDESQLRDEFLDINMKLLNPNGSFVASNISVSIVAFAENGSILGQFQETFAEEILPRQSRRFYDSVPLSMSEQVHHVEVNIDVEEFLPIDPKAITTSVIEAVSVSDDNQTVFVEISPSEGLPLARIYHGTHPLANVSYATRGIVIARNANGEIVGGGIAGENSFIPDTIPIEASELPETFEVYLNGEFFVVPCQCGGGGNWVGRDNFPVEVTGARILDTTE